MKVINFLSAQGSEQVECSKQARDWAVSSREQAGDKSERLRCCLGQSASLFPQ